MKETKVYRIPLYVSDVEKLIKLEEARSASEAIQKTIDVRLARKNFEANKHET